jgi:hypothetical protein
MTRRRFLSVRPIAARHQVALCPSFGDATVCLFVSTQQEIRMSNLLNRNVIAAFTVALGLATAGCSTGLGWNVSCPNGYQVDYKLADCDPVPTPANTLAEACAVSRQDCLDFDGANRCITGDTQLTTFTAISCGTSAKAACDKLCVNEGQSGYPYVQCSSTPVGPGPGDPGFCSPTTNGQLYDVSCTNQGRTCTGTQVVNNCSQLNTEESSGTLTATCYDPGTKSGFGICGNLPAGNGEAIWGSHITAASYKPHVGACSTSRALTSNDMEYGIPAGKSVPVTVGGQNVTLTTSGGRLVVNYACSGAASGGYACVASQVKDLWIGLNPVTINGVAFSNISFANAGAIAFNADGTTLSTAPPGFMVSAALGGGAIWSTAYQPEVPIKFVGSLGSAPFTLASTFDLPVHFGAGPYGTATAHVTMNLAGTTFNSSGSPGGIQINCGNNGAIGTWVADQDFSGGAEKNRNVEIDTSGVINPAPQLVYQNQHYSSPFSYTIGGFTPGSAHLVRLHFAETNPLNDAAKKRLFSVAINGTTQISNLDLFATVGMNKAYVKQFNINANGAGAYVLSFTASADSATISGIEVL